MFHSYLLLGASELLSTRYPEISILHVKVFQVSSLVCIPPSILEIDLYTSLPSVLLLPDVFVVSAGPVEVTIIFVWSIDSGSNVRSLMAVIYYI